MGFTLQTLLQSWLCVKLLHGCIDTGVNNLFYHQTFTLKWRCSTGFALSKSENKVFWKVSRGHNLTSFLCFGSKWRRNKLNYYYFCTFYFLLKGPAVGLANYSIFKKCYLILRPYNSSGSFFLKKNCVCSLWNAVLTNSVETKLTLDPDLDLMWEIFRTKCNCSTLSSIPLFSLTPVTASFRANGMWK